MSNTAVQDTVPAETALGSPAGFGRDNSENARSIYQTIPNLQGSGSTARSEPHGQDWSGSTINIPADCAPSRGGLPDSIRIEECNGSLPRHPDLIFQGRMRDPSAARAKATRWEAWTYNFESREVHALVIPMSAGADRPQRHSLRSYHRRVARRHSNLETLT